MSMEDNFHLLTAWEDIPGTPEHSRLEKWDKRFLRMAREVSTWSKDPSTQVGAVLVKDGCVVGMGYNGFPRGVKDAEERYLHRETKYSLIVHAEVNAVLQAGHASNGSTLYVYPAFPMPPICGECAKVAIQAGVSGIVGVTPDESSELGTRWTDSISVAGIMWKETGLFIRSYRGWEVDGN